MTPKRLAEIEELVAGSENTERSCLALDFSAEGTRPRFLTVSRMLLEEGSSIRYRDITEGDAKLLAGAHCATSDLLAAVRQLEADKAALAARNAELERRFQTMALDARRRR